MSNDKMLEACDAWITKDVYPGYAIDEIMQAPLSLARAAWKAALTQQPESEPEFGTIYFDPSIKTGPWAQPSAQVPEVLELAWYHKLPVEDGDEDDYEIFHFKSDKCDKCVEVAIVRMDHSEAAPIAEVPEREPWEASGTPNRPDMHANPDASAWADYFMETFPNCGADRDTMLGWFANAMMAMYDSIDEKPE